MILRGKVDLFYEKSQDFEGKPVDFELKKSILSAKSVDSEPKNVDFDHKTSIRVQKLLILSTKTLIFRGRPLNVMKSIHFVD